VALLVFFCVFLSGDPPRQACVHLFQVPAVIFSSTVLPAPCFPGGSVPGAVSFYAGDMLIFCGFGFQVFCDCCPSCPGRQNSSPLFQSFRASLFSVRAFFSLFLSGMARSSFNVFGFGFFFSSRCIFSYGWLFFLFPIGSPAQR